MADAPSSMPALPGFDDFLRRDVDRAGAMDLRDKKYNAINVRRDYPMTYEAVGRALFFYRLPVKTCADLFRMSPACVGAIRDQMIAASSADPRAAFLVNSRRQSQRDIVLARLMDAIAEKLSDPAWVAGMSVTELTAVLEKLEKAPPASNGTERASVPGPGPSAEVIDVTQFEDVLDGLETRKKSAALGSVGSAGECSTGNGASGASSFEMSNISAIDDDSVRDSVGNDKVAETSCKTSCSTWSAGGSRSDFACPAAEPTGPAAPEDPRGAGGPGPRAAGELTNNVSEETNG